MKKMMKPILICAIILQCILSIFAVNRTYERDTAEQERIIGIDSQYFFNDLYGTFYIYFGRPTCPECVEFELHLQTFLAKSGWMVYYFNTAYWKDESRYDDILSRYHVDSVPLLVQTVNGEFRNAYQFDPDASAEEIQEQLDHFFIDSGSGFFSVTAQNGFPIQFHDYLHTFTFLIMCSNVIYLLFRQKKIVQNNTASPLLGLIINSTLLLALHITISDLGLGFALRYEAGPATGIFAKIGTYTWLLVTPLLYFILLSICANIKIKQNKLRKESKNM